MARNSSFDGALTPLAKGGTPTLGFGAVRGLRLEVEVVATEMSDIW